jgi:purine-binding chemotaxis protein CheW
MIENSGHEQRKAIDWKEIRKRLEEAGKALEAGGNKGPDERKRILSTRARVIAKETAPEERRDLIEIIEFTLAHEHYGVESTFVSEVYPLKAYTPVPCTPAYVLGIINVRGRIISVVDIKKFFDLPERGITDLNKVIILRSGEMEFGILADAIITTRMVRRKDLQAHLPTLTGVREEYLRGVSPDGAIILDAGKILSDKGIIVQEEV